MPQEEISCDRKKFTVTGTHFMKQKEFLPQKTKFQAIGRNFILKEEISCHKAKFPATGSNFCQGEKFLLSSKDWLIKRILCAYVILEPTLSKMTVSCRNSSYLRQSLGVWPYAASTIFLLVCQ